MGPRGQLASHVLRGLLSGLAQTAVQRLVSFASQLALAAILLPSDFGLIGLAGSIAGLVQAVTDLGIEDVLLRRYRRIATWRAPAFRTLFLLLCGAGLAIAAIAPFAAALYRAPALAGLLLVIAVSTPLPALSALPGVRLRAELRFGFLAAWTSGETILSAALTIGFASEGFGAYSFVLPPLILSLVRAVLWNLAWRPARAATETRSDPAARRRAARLRRSLVGTSGFTLGAKLCWAVVAQGDYAVLGLVSGHDAVGLYWFAYRLAVQPLNMFAGTLARTLFPALAAIRDDKARQGRAALRAARLVSATVLPASLLQAAVGPPLVSRFFAARWDGAVPMIQLLSIGLGLDAVSWIAGALLSARGDYRGLFRWMLLYTPLFLLLVAAGSSIGGGAGTAAAVLVYYAVTQPVFVRSVFRPLGVTRGEIAGLYLAPLLTGGTASLAGLAAASLLPRDALLARAVAIGVVGVLAYAPLLRLAQRDVWDEFGSRLAPALSRIARPVRTGSSVAPSAVPSRAGR